MVRRWFVDGSTGSPQVYRGAKFTKAHQPVMLVYTEEYEDDHRARTDERSKSRDQACLGSALQGGGNAKRNLPEIEVSDIQHEPLARMAA